MRTKLCPKCGQEKPATDFHAKPSAKDGLYSICKTCRSKYSKQVYLNNPLDRKIRNLKNQHGISLAQYHEMIEKSKGLCAICGRKPIKRLVVDHDHKSGKIRGLLCQKCNSGLGNFNDEPLILMQAIEYLQRPVIE